MTAKKSAPLKNDELDAGTPPAAAEGAPGGKPAKAVKAVKAEKASSEKTADKPAGDEGGAKRGRKPKATATATAESKKTDTKAKIGRAHV